MPDRPVGIDMKLLQPNMGLNYPLDYVKTRVIVTANLYSDY